MGFDSLLLMMEILFGFMVLWLGKSSFHAAAGNPCSEYARVEGIRRHHLPVERVGGRGHHAGVAARRSKEHQDPLGCRMLLLEGGGGCRSHSLCRWLRSFLTCISPGSGAACGEGQGWHSRTATSPSISCCQGWASNLLLPALPGCAVPLQLNPSCGLACLGLESELQVNIWGATGLRGCMPWVSDQFQ